MTDPLALIRDRLAKTEARIVRHERALESAKSAASDLRTALRVMEDITGESSPSGDAGSPVVGTRQHEILGYLQEGEAAALAPATLFESYKLMASEDITLDTFRTTIWRMKDKQFFADGFGWTVRGHEGRYWKEKTSRVLVDAKPLNENEAPTGNATGASEARGWGAPPPSPPVNNPNPWPGA
jgi:hypothetical protein